MKKLLLALLALIALQTAAMAQTACTISAQSTLLSQFSDNAGVGSITPRNVRNVICSSVQASATGGAYIGGKIGASSITSSLGTCAVARTDAQLEISNCLNPTQHPVIACVDFETEGAPNNECGLGFFGLTTTASTFVETGALASKFYNDVNHYTSSQSSIALFGLAQDSSHNTVETCAISVTGFSSSNVSINELYNGAGDCRDSALTAGWIDNWQNEAIKGTLYVGQQSTASPVASGDFASFYSSANSGKGVSVENASTGTGATSYVSARNSAHGFGIQITSTGFSGALLTNGPSGEQGALNTSAAIPLCLGTNTVMGLCIDGSQVMQLAAANFAAPDSVATVLGSIGPAGSHTTVQTWLAIKDGSGTTRYIPAF